MMTLHPTKDVMKLGIIANKKALYGCQIKKGAFR